MCCFIFGGGTIIISHLFSPVFLDLFGLRPLQIKQHLLVTSSQHIDFVWIRVRSNLMKMQIQT